MEYKIKILAEAITHKNTHNLIQSHVKELNFNNNHLVIYVDNAGPLHELEQQNADEHLCKGLEDVYGEDITYELKLYKGNGSHEREKQIPRAVRQ